MFFRSPGANFFVSFWNDLPAPQIARVGRPPSKSPIRDSQGSLGPEPGLPPFGRQAFGPALTMTGRFAIEFGASRGWSPTCRLMQRYANLAKTWLRLAGDLQDLEAPLKSEPEKRKTG